MQDVGARLEVLSALFPEASFLILVRDGAVPSAGAAPRTPQQVLDWARAWVRSAQVRAHLRREVGQDWWRLPGTGELLRELFREGTRPTTEEIAGRIGYDPLDTTALVAETASAA